MSSADAPDDDVTERTWLEHTTPTECGVDGCEESFHLKLAREYHYLREHVGL